MTILICIGISLINTKRCSITACGELGGDHGSLRLAKNSRENIYQAENNYKVWTKSLFKKSKTTIATWMHQRVSRYRQNCRAAETCEDDRAWEFHVFTTFSQMIGTPSGHHVGGPSLWWEVEANLAGTATREGSWESLKRRHDEREGQMTGLARYLTDLWTTHAQGRRQADHRSETVLLFMKVKCCFINYSLAELNLIQICYTAELIHIVQDDFWYYIS